MTLRADYREHLARFQRDVGVKHIRGHGLLDDDMSTLLGGSASLYNLFSTMDFYQSVGLRPILELSFMPKALAWNSSLTIMHYNGITAAPADPKAWTAFITEVISGLRDRYGLDELRQWKFEVWNEPAGCGFFCPRPGMDAYSGYLELYAATEAAVHGVDPLLSIGGPATAGLGWVEQFIANSTAGGGSIPLNFLSTHAYPTDARPCPGACSRTGFEDNVAAAAATAAAAGLPFVLTEFSAGLDNHAYDAPFAAAFLVHITAAWLGNANISSASFWTFSDIFEEGGFISTPYTDRFGAQTIYGVPKPSYRALQLLSHFPRSGVPVSAPGQTPRSPALGPAAAATATVGNVDVMTAMDASQGTTVSLQALVTNYNYNGQNATDPSVGLPVQTEAVTLEWTGLPGTAQLPSNATITLIDSTHAWAKPVWIAAGSPTYPTAAEIQAEMDASALVAQPIGYTSSNSGGVVTITITLPPLEPYAVALVVFEYGIPAQ